MGGRIALLIGSGSYGVGALQQLHAPAGDVRELAVVLGDAYAGGFDTVIELIDASTQQVGREIARTLDRCKRDDLVLLYFSGHALLDDEGQLHLAMRDTEPDLLSPTSISAAFVAGEFDRSRSRRQLVILDCCAGTGFAHGTAEAAALIAPDAPRVASAFYAESQPRAVFAACRRATDSARPHSRFTHALIQGLRGAADGDGDGRISIDDLARYLEPHASAWLGEAVGSLLIANTSPRASSPPRAAARPPHPGGLISDRYRIESVLAERGIGVLCSAIDERDGRPVSVKYLRSPESSDATTLQRFLREAGVAGAIGHPNLLTIRDVGFERSTAFIVMDPLAGESLATLLRRSERLRARETVEIALQASAGVAAAHAQRLVHRDLNPEHIFVGRNPDGSVGQVKVLGFGASTLLDANDVAQAGALIGSPHYMAPEQVLGGPPDVRADVYSLGAIMYQALTGQRPFEAENHGALLFKISNETPPAPSSWVPELPAALESIVIQAMARDPAHRFADVESLQTALYEAGVAHGWLHGDDPQPMAAEPQALEQPVNTPIVFDRLPRSSLAPEPRRWPIVLGATAAVVAGAAVWLLYTPPRAESPSSAPQTTTRPEPAHAPEPAPEPALQAAPQPSPPPDPAPSPETPQPSAAEPESTETPWRAKLREQAAERRAAREARIQARLEAEEAARQAQAELKARRDAEREARAQAKLERAQAGEAEQQARAEAAAQKAAERQARKEERAQAAEAARQARAEAAAQAAAVRAATKAANRAREQEPQPEQEPTVLAVQAQEPPAPEPPRTQPHVQPLPEEPPAPTPPPQP